MILSVPAKVLQLVQSATSQKLPQKQEEPVDSIVFHRNDGFCRVLMLAELAGREDRVGPAGRGPFPHGALVLG